MSQQYSPRPDTKAWIFQVWVSFIVSVLLCAVGIWNLPHEGLDRAFLAVGYFFCLTTAFTLAKTIRDNRDEQVDTSFWVMQVWCAFLVAFVLTGWGLYRMDIEVWRKGYMVATSLFLVSSSFVLAKTIRDNHEAAILSASTPSESGSTQ